MELMNATKRQETDWVEKESCKKKHIKERDVYISIESIDEKKHNKQTATIDDKAPTHNQHEKQSHWLITKRCRETHKLLMKKGKETF